MLFFCCGVYCALCLTLSLFLAAGRSGLAWLACGPQLEVVHAVTGQRFSAYRFSGVTENPPSILAVRDFSWLKRSGLLVGLEEDEGSMLCLYDLGISRVVKAVVIPGRVSRLSTTALSFLHLTQEKRLQQDRARVTGPSIERKRAALLVAPLHYGAAALT